MKNNNNYLNFKSEIFYISRCFPEQWSDKNYKEFRDTVFHVESGCCTITIDGHMFTASANDIILIPKNSFVELFDKCDNLKLGFCCGFEATFNDTKLFDILHTIYHINIEHLDHIRNILKTISLLIDDNDMTSKLKTESYLILLMSELIKYATDKQIDELNGVGFVSKINAYIGEHISDKLSIDVLAEITGYHPKYFIVLFKRCMGDTPAHYIRKVRLERAKFLLTYSDLKISEIAPKVGFPSQSKFANIFKDYTGMTASEYRYISKMHTDTENT